MRCELSFTVETTGRIAITRFETWESRGECAVEILADLVANWPELFLGRSGAIWYGDSPPPVDWGTRSDLGFCSTKLLGSPSPYIPFPCPMVLRWPQVGIPDAQTLMEQLLADESAPKSNKIFWIGADTHESRRKLVEMGRKFPDLFDVEMMEWDRNAPDGQRSKTRQVSIPDHRKFKYLVDCPGVGYSARVKWLLATGRPVFMIERRVVEHWHEDMKPWVHFVPVAADLSDLLEHHTRLEEDPALYEEIGRNARRFAAEHLTVEALLEHTAEAVLKATQADENGRYTCKP